MCHVLPQIPSEHTGNFLGGNPDFPPSKVRLPSEQSQIPDFSGF